jgi:hypothetical protein
MSNFLFDSMTNAEILSSMTKAHTELGARTLNSSRLMRGRPASADDDWVHLTLMHAVLDPVCQYQINYCVQMYNTLVAAMTGNTMPAFDTFGCFGPIQCNIMRSRYQFVQLCKHLGLLAHLTDPSITPATANDIALLALKPNQALAFKSFWIAKGWYAKGHAFLGMNAFTSPVKEYVKYVFPNVNLNSPSELQQLNVKLAHTMDVDVLWANTMMWQIGYNWMQQQSSE